MLESDLFSGSYFDSRYGGFTRSPNELPFDDTTTKLREGRYTSIRNDLVVHRYDANCKHCNGYNSFGNSTPITYLRYDMGYTEVFLKCLGCGYIQEVTDEYGYIKSQIGQHYGNFREIVEQTVFDSHPNDQTPIILTDLSQIKATILDLMERNTELLEEVSHLRSKLNMLDTTQEKLEKYDKLLEDPYEIIKRRNIIGE